MDHKPNTATLLPLEDYDLIICSFSGGKDSLAALLHLLEAGVPKDKIELWHQCIDGEPGTEGFMDWPVTESYVQAVGDAFGIPVRFQWKVNGFEGEMLREGRRTMPNAYQLTDGTVKVSGGTRGKEATRLMFPQKAADLSVRWCSAYLKIDVCSAAICGDPLLKSAKVLLVTGERRQESAARSKYAEVEGHKAGSGQRTVHQWRAVIDWTEEEVWAIIRRWRVQPHPAYRMGFGRVSCMMCIFADADQWATIRQIAPARFRRVSEFERRFGKTIDRVLSVDDQADKGTPYVADPEVIQQALDHTFTAADVIMQPGTWMMPAGAFRHCGGPL
jgi:3'-phosphoadenosine 5'-phosphosulfate sulfotransferase (PAPS reductase)/FAD synthetase